MVETLDSNEMNSAITRLNPLNTNDTEIYGSIDSGLKGR